MICMRSGWRNDASIVNGSTKSYVAGMWSLLCSRGIAASASVLPAFFQKRDDHVEENVVALCIGGTDGWRWHSSRVRISPWARRGQCGSGCAGRAATTVSDDDVQRVVIGAGAQLNENLAIEALYLTNSENTVKTGQR
jgi:hypothetical protein